MKIIKSIYTSKIVLLVFVIINLTFGKSIAQNISSSLEKEKMVSPSSVIYINNSVKNLEIHTWEQEQIKQIVNIEITPVDPNEAKELLSQFDFEIQSTFLGNIELEYDLGIEKMGEFTDKKIKTKKGEITIVLKNGKVYTVKEFNVSIILYIPTNNELVLDSRFSAVSLGNLSNKVKLKLTNVILKANNIDQLELYASFSTVWFTSVNMASFETTNCEVNIGKLKVAKIESRFSKYNINTVQELNIDKAASDTYNILNVDEIYCDNASFTNFNIRELKYLMNISSRNGDIKIENVNEEFSQIDIDNSISTITIGTLNIDEFVLNANVKYTKFNLSSNITPITEVGKETYYKGSRMAKQKINIDCVSCNVIIK